MTRGLDHPMYGLLHPHNEHWSTLPILVYRGLVNLVGVRTYVPFLAVLVALHLALAHLLWRSCLRVGASMMVATALTAAFVVLGAGLRTCCGRSRWASSAAFSSASWLSWLRM